MIKTKKTAIWQVCAYVCRHSIISCQWCSSCETVPSEKEKRKKKKKNVRSKPRRTHFRTQTLNIILQRCSVASCTQCVCKSTFACRKHLIFFFACIQNNRLPIQCHHICISQFVRVQYTVEANKKIIRIFRSNACVPSISFHSLISTVCKCAWSGFKEIFCNSLNVFAFASEEKNYKQFKRRKIKRKKKREKYLRDTKKRTVLVSIP